MKQTVKTIITVFVALFFCIAGLVGAILGYNKIQYLEYDAGNLTDPLISDIRITCLGESYQGDSREGVSYYQMAITLDNQSNYGKTSSNIYFYCNPLPADSFYYIEVLSDIGSFSYENANYLPAGKEGTIYKILMIEDGCESFQIVMNHNNTDQTQTYLVEL